MHSNTAGLEKHSLVSASLSIVITKANPSTSTAPMDHSGSRWTGRNVEGVHTGT